MNFIVTVDTEADNQWDKKAGLSVRNLKFVPRFQELCEKHFFVPTYLLTSEVVNDQEFSRWLKSKHEEGSLDIGAHLHPWTTGPFADDQEKTGRQFLSVLEEQKIEEKINTLTTEISRTLNIKPVSFRAGRWAFNHTVGEILVRHGYKIDSSVTPLIDWSKGDESAPTSMNFSQAGHLPYEVIPGLLEVPMSIFPVPRFFWNPIDYRPVVSGQFGRLLNKFFYKITWCRIFPETKFNDLVKCYRYAEMNNFPTLQFMVHSSEFMPGGSIYNKNPEDVERFYSLFEDFLVFLKKQEINPVGLSDMVNLSYTRN